MGINKSWYQAYLEDWDTRRFKQRDAKFGSIVEGEARLDGIDQEELEAYEKEKEEKG